MKRLFSIWIFTLVGVVQIFAQPFAFDFSYVGYQQSEKEIPDADVVVFVKWKEGDQSARIQKAIDFVSARKWIRRRDYEGLSCSVRVYSNSHSRFASRLRAWC